MSEIETTTDSNGEESLSVTINREMYDDLREKGYYIGEDDGGTRVHLHEDFTSVGPSGDEHDTWGPVFPIEDAASDIDRDETVADHRSKKALLRAEPEATLQVTAVHAGMQRIPEKLVVVRRSNTYYGPKIHLRAAIEDDSDADGFLLTCPGPDSHPILWRSVTDSEGFVHTRSKVAKVSVEVFNVAGYDVCEQCEEPITDPLHRALAAAGQCPGGVR